MSTTFEVSEVLESAAREANVPPFATDTNVTLAQATYWAVQGARSFSARIRQAFGDDGDYLKVASLTTVASLGFMSIPEDVGEIHSVVWARTSSDYRLLRTGNMEVLEELADGDLRPWRECAEPRYRLEGETLAFYPSSSEAETIILFYTNHLNLSEEAYFPARLDTDRWLVLDIAARVVRAQGRDPSLLTQEKLMLEQNVFAPSRGRLPKEIHTIRDTRGCGEGHWFRGRWSNR